MTTCMGRWGRFQSAYPKIVDGSPSRSPNLGCCSQGQKWRLTTGAGSSPCLSKGVGGRWGLKPGTLRGPVCRGHVPHSRSSARTSYATLDRPTEPSRTAVFSSAKWEEWRTYLAELPRARNPRAAGAGQDGGPQHPNTVSESVSPSAMCNSLRPMDCSPLGSSVHGVF